MPETAPGKPTPIQRLIGSLAAGYRSVCGEGSPHRQASSGFHPRIEPLEKRELLSASPLDPPDGVTAAEVGSLNPGAPDALAVDAVMENSLTELAWELQQQYIFSYPGSYYENEHGLGEKTVRSNTLNAWVGILPNGNILNMDKGKELLHAGDPAFHEDPSLLFNASADTAPPPGAETTPPEPEVSPTLTELASSLQTQYRFRINGQMYFNEHKMNEKELWSDTLSDWVIILPNGDIHRPGNGYPFLVASDPAFYEDPSLLFDAQESPAEEPAPITGGEAASAAPSLQALAWGLQQQYDFSYPGSYYENEHGLHEKTVRSVVLNAWVGILPNGNILNMDKGKELLHTGDPAFHEDPSLLFNASADTAPPPVAKVPPPEPEVSPTLTDLASSLQTQYRFRINGQLYFNEHKRNEKEFWSDTLSDWVIILPNGDIHRPGNGYPLLVASDPAFYADPSLLFNASADTAPPPDAETTPPEPEVSPTLTELASSLQTQYRFRVNGQLYFNEHKMSEKEFWSDTLSNWVIMLPNGDIHTPGGGYPFLVASDPALYTDISLLLDAQPLTAQEQELLTDPDAAVSPVLQSLNLVATPVQPTSETLLSEAFEGGWDAAKFMNQESTWANGHTAVQGNTLHLGNRDRFRTVETFRGTDSDLVDFSGTFSFTDAEQLFINVYTGSTLDYEGHRPRNELQFAVNMLDVAHPVLTAHGIQDGAYAELAQAKIRLEQNTQYQFHVVCDNETATLTILDEAGSRIRQMSVPIPAHLAAGGHMGVSNERHPVLGGVRVHSLAVGHTDLQKLGSASALPYTPLSVLRLMDPEASVALKFGELQRAYESVSERSLAMQQADVSLLSTENLTLAVDQLRDTGSFFRVQQQEFEQLMALNMPHAVTDAVALSGMAAEAVEYGERIRLTLNDLGGYARLRAWQGSAASAALTQGQLPDSETLTGTGKALALDLSESDSFVTGVSFVVQTGDASPVTVVFQRGDREIHTLQAASGETVSFEDAAGITGAVILSQGAGTQVTLSALGITGTKNIDQLDTALLSPVSSAALSQAAFPALSTESFDLVTVAYANSVGFSMGDHWCNRQYIHHSPGAYLRLSMPEELNGQAVNAILGSLYYLDANGLHTLPPEWYEVIDARRIVVGPGAPEHLAIAGGYNPALGVTPGEFYSEVAPAEDMNLTVNVELVQNGFTDQAGFGGRIQPPSRYKNPVVFGAAHLQANIVNDGQAGGQVIVNVYSGYLEGTLNPLQGTYVAEIQANDALGLTANFALEGAPPTDQTHGKVVLEVVYPDGHTQISQYETALPQSTFGTERSPDGGDNPGPEVVRTAATQAARIANDLLARAGEATGTERDEKMQQAIAYVNRQENRLEIIASLPSGTRSLFNALLADYALTAATDTHIRGLLLARQDGDISNDPRFAWLAQDLHTEVRDGVQVLVYSVEGVEHSFPIAPSIAMHDSLKDAAMAMEEGVQSELYAATDAFFDTLPFTGGLSRLSVTGESLRETLTLHRGRLAGIPYIGNRFAADVWNDLDGINPETIILSDYDVRTVNPEVPSGTNALDRWYATRGEAPIEITWSTSVDQDGTYSFQLQGCDNWDLDRAMLIIDNQHAMPLVSQNSRLNFHLSAGGHTFRIIGLGVPQEAGVSDASFVLRNNDGIAPVTVSDLSTMLIADHPEEFDETSEFQIYDLSGAHEVTGVTNLAKHFAPILHFHQNETYNRPISAEDVWNQVGGDSNLGEDHLDFSNLDVSQLSTAVYSNVLRRDESNMAISYLFFYPKSNWEDHAEGGNTHEGDWEGVTIFFIKSELEGDSFGKWIPTKIAMAQHLDIANNIADNINSDGGDYVNWGDPLLDIENSHPHLYIGLGGHATYACSGQTDVAGRIEDHSSTDLGLETAGYIVNLERMSSSNLPTWMRYQGLWGADGSEFDGSKAPYGPIFMNTSWYGDEIGVRKNRWLNPWSWAENFNDVNSRDYE